MRESIMIIISIILMIATSCQSQTANQATKSTKVWSLDFPETIEKIEKSKKEWKGELSKMEYHVLREKGTERSYTGDLLDVKEKGIYVCRGCGLPLFDATTKYESGTGWPSFYQPIKAAYIIEDVDYNIGYARTEVLCARCNGHLGHVFPDGPKPTGLRYCINSVSLDFIELKKEH